MCNTIRIGKILFQSWFINLLFSGPQNHRIIPPSSIHNHPLAVHQISSPNGNAYQYHPSSGSKMQQINTSPTGPGGIQPLYANAPPKPRRMNTSRDQSPSPERMGANEDSGGFMSPPLNPPYGGPHPQQANDPMMVHGRYHHPLTDVHQAHIIVDDIPPSYRMRPPHERRTPEAYGRMSQIQQRIQHAQQTPRMPPMQDYEDIYNTQMMQQQQQQLGMIIFRDNLDRRGHRCCRIFL